MGADFKEHEEGIEIVRNLPVEAKMALSHHLRNELQGIIGGLESDDIKMVKRAALHMVDDLNKFGL